MRKLLLILLCFPFLVFSQDEKRLALVIGNANYDKGELKNPVNDALLIAETLKKLEFDVVLDTNIANKSDFIDAVMKFGDRRVDYDVAFVYYAGHGIQVGTENYLLPTQVDFQKETDVRMKALAVQDIMMYLTGMTDQVNVLILDACRDNPFEGNWNATRSLKGSGLAKMKAPMGSLIAFSTTAGNTAPDGVGKNSIYCTSLVKNMQLEDVNLDQVFRNVRAEVLQKTNGRQQTEEATQLTGETFYLVKSTYEKEFDLIDSLMSSNEYSSALNMVSIILENDPKNIRALDIKADVYYFFKDYRKAVSFYKKIIEIDPDNAIAYKDQGAAYFKLSDFDKSLESYENAIKLDPDNMQSYIGIGNIYFTRKMYQDALNAYKKVGPQSLQALQGMAAAYLFLGEEKQSIDAYSKMIKLDSNNYQSYLGRARVYDWLFIQAENADKNQKRYRKQSIEDYKKVIKIDSNNLYAHFEIAQMYFILMNKGSRSSLFGDKEKAIKHYNKAIELDPKSAYTYYQRSQIHYFSSQYIEALEDINTALKIDKNKIEEDEDFHTRRGNIYESLSEYDLALKDFDQHIKKYNDHSGYATKGSLLMSLNRYEEASGVYKLMLANGFRSQYVYQQIARVNLYLNKYEESIKYAKKSLELSKIQDEEFGLETIGPETSELLLIMGDAYKYLEDFEKSIECAQEGLKSKYIYKSVRISHYNMLGYNYFRLKKYNKSIKNFSLAIEIDSEIKLLFFNRARTYISLGDLKRAEDDLNTAIEIDYRDPEGYYYLSIIFESQDKLIESIDMLTYSIIRLLDGDYYIPSFDRRGHVELKDIYINRGEIYQSLGIHIYVCHNFKKACDLGDCEMFNTYCK